MTVLLSEKLHYCLRYIVRAFNTIYIFCRILTISGFISSYGGWSEIIAQSRIKFWKQIVKDTTERELKKVLYGQLPSLNTLKELPMAVFQANMKLLVRFDSHSKLAQSPFPLHRLNISKGFGRHGIGTFGFYPAR